jgi:hypothetical protein
MIDPTSGLLAGICGLGIVCSGLLLIVAVVAIRMTGRGLIPLLSLIMNRWSDRKRTPEAPLPRRPRVNLRARAQSVDFDSALAQANGQPPVAPPTAPPAGTITQESGALPPVNPSVPWRRGRRAENDDFWGGVVDADEP